MIRNQTDSIVIKPKMSPVFRSLIIIVPIIVFICGVIAAYLYGHWEVSAELNEAQATVAELTQQNQILKEHNERAQDSLIKLQGQLDIDDSAYAQMRAELEQSNNQLAELTRELNFYRSIISPDNSKQGVQVQDISIVPTEKPQTYKYRLVLIQTLQHGKQLSASLKFTIKGESNGTLKTISRPEADKDRLKVNFKYFQNLTGTLELPDNFVPRELRVDLAGKKKKSLLDEQWYPWPGLNAS